MRGCHRIDEVTDETVKFRSIRVRGFIFRHHTSKDRLKRDVVSTFLQMQDFPGGQDAD